MRRIVTLAPAIVCCCSLGLPLVCHATEHTPPLMHGEVYDGDEHVDFTRYWVSEKLDGVRAYWNGEHLLTRAGNVIAAPGWFTKDWPSTPMDGELWGGRGTFERTSGIVRSARPRDEDWRTLEFRVFDLPAAPGTFDERLSSLNALIKAAGIEWLAPVAQERVRSAKELRAKLERVETSGGEGLMLRRGDSLYVAGRTDDLLKYKSYEDAEAKVIGYVSGNGKYDGMTGALLVESSDGRRFKIGSGLTDAERREPPAIGRWITYAYNGLTESGLPRFARYLRVRHEVEDLSQR